MPVPNCFFLIDTQPPCACKIYFNSILPCRPHLPRGLFRGLFPVKSLLACVLIALSIADLIKPRNSIMQGLGMCNSLVIKHSRSSCFRFLFPKSQYRCGQSGCDTKACPTFSFPFSFPYSEIQNKTQCETLKLASSSLVGFFPLYRHFFPVESAVTLEFESRNRNFQV
jgi:hypothetical protein